MFKKIITTFILYFFDGMNITNNPKRMTNILTEYFIKKCTNELTKIHDQKYNTTYDQLLHSTDPIPNHIELVKALSDPDDKIRKNDKIPDDKGMHIIILDSDRYFYHDVLFFIITFCSNKHFQSSTHQSRLSGSKFDLVDSLGGGE